MSNHVHLGTLAGKEPLDWIRRVHSPFATAMNKERGRIGVMFVRGPKAIATPPERVAGLLAYIHNNPVRAGVVGHAADCAWTSHGEYLGIRPAPKWLRVDDGLALAGFRDRFEFDRWVCDPNRRDPEDFVRDCHVAFRALDVRPRRQHPASVDPVAVVGATAAELGLPVLQLQSRRRGVIECTARAVAIHCAAKLGLTGTAIADAIGMSQQRVSVIQRSSPANLEGYCDRVIHRLTSERNVKLCK
jgi:hypothetical protein